jgi:hypothetical protein
MYWKYIWGRRSMAHKFFHPLTRFKGTTKHLPSELNFTILQCYNSNPSENVNPAERTLLYTKHRLGFPETLRAVNRGVQRV